MSYDLHLLKEADARDPLASLERQEADEDRLPTPEEEAELRAIAAELMKLDRRLDISEPLVGFLLQLGYDNECPVVVDLAPGSLTMSWSYGAADPEAAIATVERYLPVFAKHGYVAYDPQLDGPFDAAAARAVHGDVRGRVFGDEAPKRSLWHRLFG